MSVQNYAKCQYDLRDNESSITDPQLTLIKVIELVPDITNDELGSILALNVGMSIDIDTNITVYRTK
jgi:hypothetical protein